MASHSVFLGIGQCGPTRLPADKTGLNRFINKNTLFTAESDCGARTPGLDSTAQVNPPRVVESPATLKPDAQKRRGTRIRINQRTIVATTAASVVAGVDEDHLGQAIRADPRMIKPLIAQMRKEYGGRAVDEEIVSEEAGII